MWKLSIADIIAAAHSLVSITFNVEPHRRRCLRPKMPESSLVAQAKRLTGYHRNARRIVEIDANLQNLKYKIII